MRPSYIASRYQSRPDLQGLIHRAASRIARYRPSRRIIIARHHHRAASPIAQYHHRAVFSIARHRRRAALSIARYHHRLKNSAFRTHPHSAWRSSGLISIWYASNGSRNPSPNTSPSQAQSPESVCPAEQRQDGELLKRAVGFLRIRIGVVTCNTDQHGRARSRAPPRS
jgi:hypothetical protein